MKTRMAVAAVAALLLRGLLAAAPEAAPAVVTLGDNERVVHIAGAVFTHAYYEPRLETLLLRLGAARGLTFRQVDAGGGLAALNEELETRVIALKPTLVIIQAGTDDLIRQYRRQTRDFAAFPKTIDTLLARLRAAGCRAVLCSPTPVGNGSAADKLLPPNDGLKGWVDAARDAAARHGVPYADLFSDALSWPMIGNDARARYFYDVEGHAKSWELLLRQVTFRPATPPATEIDVKALVGRSNDGEVAELKAEAGAVAFTLKARSSGGGHALKVIGLPAGGYQITADGKPALKASAGELGTGVDIGPFLHISGSAKELREESGAGRAAFAAVNAVEQYRLPQWVAVPDFDRQKAAALAQAQAALAAHDDAAARLAAPAPLMITLTPLK
jgi:lysophospholipase L1-like esterase